MNDRATAPAPPARGGRFASIRIARARSRSPDRYGASERPSWGRAVSAGAVAPAKAMIVGTRSTSATGSATRVRRDSRAADEHRDPDRLLVRVELAGASRCSPFM